MAVPFREAVRTWTRVAALSFGGPAGQIAVMHRILVEEKGWIGERRFLHALNYCMLLPGPEAMQLATYIGWLLHGIRGGLVAGGLFVLPGFLSILALSILYLAWRDLGPVAALLFGIKAVVVAIVFAALVKMARKALLTRAHGLIALAAFLAIFVFGLPFPWIVGGALLIGLSVGQWWPDAFIAAGHDDTAEDDSGARSAPGPGWTRSLAILLLFGGAWLAPVALLWAWLGPDDVFTQLAVFFSRLAVVTFGGAYAALAYMAQEAVQTHAWLSAGEMIDGLGLAEATPGPLVQVTQFVAYLAGARFGELPSWAGGVAASVLVTWVVFVPSFLFVFLGAPWVERLHGNVVLRAALGAVTAAVVGVILNLSLWFSLHVLFGELHAVSLGPGRLLVPAWSTLDPVATVIALAAIVALMRFRAPMLPVLFTGALVGAVWEGLARAGIIPG